LGVALVAAGCAGGGADEAVETARLAPAAGAIACH
jgi:hypothetical protein